MRFWFREFTGWALILLGLVVFYLCISVLMTEKPQIINSGPIAFIGFVIFRGGIHLLKTAVAARVVLHGQREIIRQQMAERSRDYLDVDAKRTIPLDW